MQQTTKFKYVLESLRSRSHRCRHAVRSFIVALQSEFIHIYWLIKMSISLAAPRNCNCNEVLAAQQTQRVEKLYFISSNEEKSYIFIRSAKWTRRRRKATTRSRQIGSRKWEMEKRSPTGWAIVVETELWRRSCCTSLCHTHIEFDTQLTDSTHTHTHTYCIGIRISVPAKGLESYNFWAFHMCPEPGTSLTRSQDFLVPSQPTNPLIRPLRHSPVSCTCQFSLTSFE